MGLEHGPDHSTLCRAYGSLSEAQQRALNPWLLRQQAVQTTVVAVDSISFSLIHASQHYISRCGRAMTTYRKGFYVVDVDRHYILGWREAKGPMVRTLSISTACAAKPILMLRR